MWGRAFDSLRIAMLTVVLSGVTALSQHGKTEFSITIHGPESVKAGTYIVVDILVTNTSNNVIPFDDADFPSEGEANFGVDVFDAQGELAPRTAVGRALRGEKPRPGEFIGMSTGHYMQRDLKPGETLRESVALSQFFEMKPGRYTVVVSRPDYQAERSTRRHEPGDSDINKPVPPQSDVSVNPPRPKPKGITKSNTITLTVVPD